MNGDSIEKVWDKINDIDKTVTRIDVGVAGLAQWKTDQHLRCMDHWKAMEELRRIGMENRERIARGLSWQQVISSVLAALVAAALVGATIWSHVSRALAALKT